MARSAALSAADSTIVEAVTRHAHGRGPGIVEAEKPSDRPMTIGEVAREFGITPRALRFYEAKRLITPQRQGAIRLYRRGDRERLTLILTGRRLGFTLTEIREVLRRHDGKGLHLTREQCVAQINLLEQQKHGIEIAIAELRRICTSFYQKLLEDTDSRRRMTGKG